MHSNFRIIVKSFSSKVRLSTANISSDAFKISKNKISTPYSKTPFILKSKEFSNKLYNTQVYSFSTENKEVIKENQAISENKVRGFVPLKILNKEIVDKNIKLETLNKQFQQLSNTQSKDYKGNGIVYNENNEILLYLSELPISNVIFTHLPYIVSLSILGIFIKFNPLYLSFPAALPIMTFMFPIVLLKYLKLLKMRKKIIKEIWLDKTGKELILKFRSKSNNIKSDKKDSTLLYPISNILVVNSEKKGIVHSDRFPTSIDNISYDNFHVFWTKYFSISKYMLIYKYPYFCNFRSLIDALNGNNITINKDLAVYEYNSNLSIEDLVNLSRLINKK